MKKNKISKSWVIRQRKDKYVRQSKLEGYRSRAVYKLKELDEKFKIIKNNLSILDIGSAPGSWTQYLSQKSKGSKIMSIDLKEVEKIKDVLGESIETLHFDEAWIPHAAFHDFYSKMHAIGPNRPRAKNSCLNLSLEGQG